MHRSALKPLINPFNSWKKNNTKLLSGYTCKTTTACSGTETVTFSHSEPKQQECSTACLDYILGRVKDRSEPAALQNKSTVVAYTVGMFSMKAHCWQPQSTVQRGQSTYFRTGRIQQAEEAACLRTWIYLLASSNQYFAFNKLEKDLGCALLPHIYLPVWKESPVYQHLLVFFHHRSQPFICKRERDLASDSDLAHQTSACFSIARHREVIAILSDEVMKLRCPDLQQWYTCLH